MAENLGERLLKTPRVRLTGLVAAAVAAGLMASVAASPAEAKTPLPPRVPIEQASWFTKGILPDMSSWSQPVSSQAATYRQDQVPFYTISSNPPVQKKAPAPQVKKAPAPQVKKAPRPIPRPVPTPARPR